MKTILTIAAVMMLALSVLADSVALGWDHSPSTDVVGYRIYVGTNSGTYSRYESVGYVNSATIEGLDKGQTYWFAATAVDSHGLESDFSNEISYTMPTNAVPNPVMLKIGE